MYAQMITISLHPDQIEEFQSLCDQYIIPELSGQRG